MNNSNKKQILFVFGTRPEAIKMAPIIEEAKLHPEQLLVRVVITGQHRHMVDSILRFFNIVPDDDLKIMEENQSIASVVAKSLLGLEKIVLRTPPDMLMVQGDTSTAFAAGLVAHYYKIPLGHVEAGLRTYDKWMPFPEELNRKLLTALSDLHFVPTREAYNNLLAEKTPPEQIYLTGNSVIDALLTVAFQKEAAFGQKLSLNPGKKLLLVTVHRRENFGNPLLSICNAVKRLAESFPQEIQVVVPVHKNPNVKGVVHQCLGEIPQVLLVDPLDYAPFVHLMRSAYFILTDSGGVQEEAPSLGKPVLVLREKTERPEAVAAGTVKLVGTDENTIFAEASQLLRDKQAYDKMANAMNPYGDGKAAGRIVQAVLYHFGFAKEKPQEFSIC
jgi:UDP-N-acetylglucosamine 2-epimerase (non-hydrolysing)